MSKSGKTSESVSPITNLLLNTAIFILAGVIIYLSYSIFLKLSDKEPAEKQITQKDTPSEIIQCEVKNGCGVNGVADRFTDYLRARKFDVVNIGNHSSFNIENTIVIDRIGNMTNAYETARILGVKRENVIQQINEDYFLDVSIIIGKDYFKLNPLK